MRLHENLFPRSPRLVGELFSTVFMKSKRGRGTVWNVSRNRFLNSISNDFMKTSLRQGVSICRISNSITRTSWKQVENKSKCVFDLSSWSQKVLDFMKSCRRPTDVTWFTLTSIQQKWRTKTKQWLLLVAVWFIVPCMYKCVWKNDPNTCWALV